MFKILIFIFCLLFVVNLYSQNLLYNGSFEIYSSLPNDYGQCNLVDGWSNVNGNYSGAPYGSPDYYNILGTVGTWLGPITAVSGNAQIGLCTFHTFLPNFREYISSKLICPLIPNRQYEVSFYITNGNNGSYSFISNNLGICFSKLPLSQLNSEPISSIPQIEIHSLIDLPNFWEQYKYIINPTDSFNHITIGNFQTDNNTSISSTGEFGAYYFIDSITVRPLPIHEDILGSDLVRCKGDKLKLQASSSYESYLWQDNSTNSYYDVEADGIYSVIVKDKCGVYTDSIYVSTIECDCPIYIPNAFSPNQDNLNDTFKPIFSCNFSSYEFSIFNRWGERVFLTKFGKDSWDGTYKGGFCPIGDYMYLIQFELENKQKKMFKGDLILIR